MMKNFQLQGMFKVKTPYLLFGYGGKTQAQNKSSRNNTQPTQQTYLNLHISIEPNVPKLNPAVVSRNISHPQKLTPISGGPPLRRPTLHKRTLSTLERRLQHPLPTPKILSFRHRHQRHHNLHRTLH